MKRTRLDLFVGALVAIVACTVVLHRPAIASAGSGAESCGRLSAGLREQLESVTEAVIDGRQAAVPAAADRAAAWWATRRRSLERRLQADSFMVRMSGAAHGRRPREAARIAVQLSVASFGWCPGTLGTADRLMLVDLAGMTGWLRARGAHLAWPGAAPAAAESLASALVGRGHTALAARLRRSMAATLSTPESASGDARAAVQLLDTVDLVEKVLH